MQISQIYSNNDKVFPLIEFNFGQCDGLLNVIVGEIHLPLDGNKDSHNLGKSTLLLLIDFLMLKGRHKDQFLIKTNPYLLGSTFSLKWH